MRVPGFIGVVIVAAVTALAGCASTNGARTSTPAVPAHEHGMGVGMGMMDTMCPMQVQGTTVASADVEGGVAIVFTTSSGDVADLRRRARHMADMHNQAGGGMMMDGGMMMPAANASVEDIDGGARVVLRPRDAAQLDALREHVRMWAGRMAHGECPMR